MFLGNGNGCSGALTVGGKLLLPDARGTARDFPRMRHFRHYADYTGCMRISPHNPNEP